MLRTAVVLLLAAVATAGCATPSPKGAPPTAVAASAPAPAASVGAEPKLTPAPNATPDVAEPREEVAASDQLVVEEHPVVGKDVDRPDHFEYMRRIDPKVLEKRQEWRASGPEASLAATNRALAALDYRLVPKDVPKDKDESSPPVYDLYRGEEVVYADLAHFWPPSPSARGDDFALVVEDARGQTYLIRNGSSERWDEMRHAFTRPVFVGDDLVFVEVADEEYVVRRGDEVVHSLGALPPRVDNPIKGLWSWAGRWVLEVDGEVLVDGERLGEEQGYSEVFGWRLLNGQPFYFFKLADRIGLSYAGQVLPHEYDEVIHYQCCEPAAFNVAGSESMVWFHALRDGEWHYVEAGVYGASRPEVAGEESKRAPAGVVGTPGSAKPATPTGSPPPAIDIDIDKGAPALSTGTIEEARKAVGVAIDLPRYLPAGAVCEEPVRYQAAEGAGLISVEYRVGQRSLTVQFVKRPADASPGKLGERVTVGRFEATVSTQPKEPSDPLPPNGEVAWRDGDVTVRVAGDLPVDELLKVARSVY